MKAVIYRRISTNEIKQKHSLSNQDYSLNLLCEMKGIEVVGNFADSASAKNMNREGLQSALAMLEEGTADCLVIQSLSRLTRSLTDMCYLLDNVFDTKHLISLKESVDTSTPAGRLQISLLSSINDFERALISQRTKDGLAAAKRSGKKLGNPKYGYNRDQERTINENEMSIVRSIKDMRKANCTYKSIVERLEESGVVGRSGNPLKMNQVVLISKYDYGADAA